MDGGRQVTLLTGPSGSKNPERGQARGELVVAGGPPFTCWPVHQHRLSASLIIATPPQLPLKQHDITLAMPMPGRLAAKRARRIVDSESPGSSPGTSNPAAEEPDEEVDADELDAEGEEEADEDVEEEEDEEEDAEGEEVDEDDDEEEDEFVDAQDQSAPGTST